LNLGFGYNNSLKHDGKMLAHFPRLSFTLGTKRDINMQKHKDSCITGDFEGWDGDTVYELDDGSKWELVSYTYSK